MKAPSTEVKSNIDWNIVWYYGSLIFFPFFAGSSILYFLGIKTGLNIFDSLFWATFLLMCAYLHKPIKIPYDMDRAEAEILVEKKIKRREIYRYSYFVLLFSICGIILFIDLFDLWRFI